MRTPPTKPAAAGGVRALLRFHGGSGLRVAWRAGAMSLGALVFAFGMSPDLLYTLQQFALSTASARPGGSGAVALAVIGLGFALQAVPRVTLGASGWVRSLPAARAAHRRATWAALWLAQLPIAAIALGCLALTLAVYRAPASAAKLASLALAAAASAALAVPVARAWRSGPLAMAALGAALASALGAPSGGRWPALALGVALLAAWDQVAGAPRAPAWRAARTWPSLSLPLPIRLAWRALGERVLLNLVPALLPLGFAWLARRNNPDFSPATAAFVARLGATLAAATYVALLANALLARRAPWAWARSLPWSAARRAWLDAAALAIPGLPLLLAAAAALDVRAALAALAVLAFTAGVGAAELRRGARRLSGAAGQTWLQGAAAAALVAVWPWLAAACALAVPLVAHRAALRDRAWRVTRWEELHHDAAGDPAWTGAP